MYLNLNFSEDLCKKLQGLPAEVVCPIWFLVFIASLASCPTLHCYNNSLQFHYVVLGISGIGMTVLGFRIESLGTRPCQGHITSNNLLEYPNMWFWHC